MLWNISTGIYKLGIRWMSRVRALWGPCRVVAIGRCYPGGTIRRNRYYSSRERASWRYIYIYIFFYCCNWRENESVKGVRRNVNVCRWDRIVLGLRLYGGRIRRERVQGQVGGKERGMRATSWLHRVKIKIFIYFVNFLHPPQTDSQNEPKISAKW